MADRAPRLSRRADPASPAPIPGRRERVAARPFQEYPAMFHRILVAAAAAFAFAATAQAAPLQATGGIFDGTAYGNRYSGPGGATPVFNQPLGAVYDGGNGAFDVFGFYNQGTAGLAQTRQVDLLTGNVFRFFDTFTNTGTQAVSTTLGFFGNLGSDGDERVGTAQGGLVVTCQDDGNGACAEDPVLALVSGNNGLGRAAIAPDRYTVGYTVSLAPGASLSLLNYAFLASDDAGPTAADLALAFDTGRGLLSAPRLEGLSAQQIASIANFDLQSVPEPGSLALVLTGLGLLGRRIRRHRRAG
jgi:hypothetical protein